MVRQCSFKRVYSVLITPVVRVPDSLQLTETKSKAIKEVHFVPEHKGGYIYNLYEDWDSSGWVSFIDPSSLAGTSYWERLTRLQ